MNPPRNLPGGGDLMMILSEDAEGRQRSKSVSVRDLLRQAIYDSNADVIVKCLHCGQWGAVKTACKTCGAPIDPPSD